MYRLIAFLLLTGLAGSVVAAGNAEAGEAKAGACVACHGPAGISPNPDWPNLAGQQEGYLLLQLKAYRDGQRQHPLMSPMVQGLSDQDLADLAAYYHSLPADGE